MALLPSNSFYSSFARRKAGKPAYQAPRSSAFGGTLGAPKAPAAPAPAPAPSPSGPVSAPQGFTVSQGGLPPDPVYALTMGGLTGTRDTTIAGLQQDRTAGLSQYGYTEDPTTHAIAFDPNNPYSQAALLRKHFQEAKTGNTTSYAASGQLYAGSLQNAQNASTDQFNQGDDALTKAVERFLANNTTAQTNANNAYNTNAGIALGTSVQNAPNNPLYSPASAAGMGGALVSGDANGNMAITAANGPAALVPQQPYSSVQLASGFSIVYGPNGAPLYMLDPNGNRVGG